MLSKCHIGSLLLETKGWIFVALAAAVAADVVAIISKSDNLVRLAFDAD